MESLIIEATSKTPKIMCIPQEGLIEFEGKSTPENAIKFYQPLSDWLTHYVKSPSKKTIVNFKLDYFNTSTSKWLLELLKKMEILHDNNQPIIVNWFCCDEDLLEYGEDYASILNLPFEFIDVEEE